MAQEWYYSDGDRTVGPLTSQQLKQAAADGSLRPTDLVWAAGSANRVAAEKVKGLRLGPQSNAPSQPAPVRRARPDTRKATGPSNEPEPTLNSTPGTLVEQGWLIGLSLICCFPVGLVLVWLHPRLPKAAKWAVTGVIAVIMLAAFAASANRDKQADQPLSPANQQVGGERGTATKDYQLPHKDFVAYIDGCLRSNEFVTPPADAPALADEPLTEELLPYSAGAEGWWEKRVMLDGKTGILLFDRNEVGDGQYADVLTASGIFTDGQRKITRTGLKEQTARHRRRVRDGLVEVGW